MMEHVTNYRVYAPFWLSSLEGWDCALHAKPILLTRRHHTPTISIIPLKNAASRPICAGRQREHRVSQGGGRRVLPEGSRHLRRGPDCGAGTPGAPSPALLLSPGHPARAGWRCLPSPSLREDNSPGDGARHLGSTAYLLISDVGHLKLR